MSRVPRGSVNNDWVKGFFERRGAPLEPAVSLSGRDDYDAVPSTPHDDIICP
jgi:hypothetical protein